MGNGERGARKRGIGEGLIAIFGEFLGFRRVLG